MQTLMYDPINKLNKSKTTWRIKVRVMRIWPTRNNEKNEISGYNLILCDEDESLIHAFVYADQWPAIEKKVKIKAGSIYVIQNFNIKDAYGKLRPVFSKNGITFTNKTIVTEVMQDDHMIPTYKFEFIDLGELDKFVKETPKDTKEEMPEFAIDIIGAVEKNEGVRKVDTRNGLRDQFVFMVTDGRKSNKVTVWGDDAVFLSQKMEKEEIRPIIIIMNGTKLFKRNETVYIGTLSYTKIYLNLEDDVVVAMRSRLEESGYKPGEVVAECAINDDPITIEMLTLKQLNEISNREYVMKDVFCRIKVNKIEDQDSWWYNSCNVCQEEVLKVEGKFKCLTCSRTMPVAQKRYKLCILAEDETDACNIFLLDKAMKKIIGASAPKLLAEMNKDNANSKDFPQRIKDIVGKNFTLNIVIHEDNIVNDSSIYYASGICDFKSTNEVSNSNASQIEYPSSNFTETTESAKETDTPGTAQSTSKSRLSSDRTQSDLDEVPNQVLFKKVKQEKEE